MFWSCYLTLGPRNDDNFWRDGYLCLLQEATTAGMATINSAKQETRRILRRLKADYPEVTCELNHEIAFQLLTATICSAQCTDERVNIVTADLFAKYPDAAALAAAPLKALEKIIQSTGFFRAKAKNIKACATALVERHGGKVPASLDELVTLAGVGRKTANVVLGTYFGIPTGVVVDTHVSRISQRLGMTSHTDPVRIERDLMATLPKKEWINFSHRVIHHGRAICKARKPACDVCSMEKFCPRIGVKA